MKKSLFALYKEERQGRSVIETDEYFFIYYLPNPETFYLEDIFVREDLRGTGFSKKIFNKICFLAKELGCKKMIGSCRPSTRGADRSLKIMLHEGFNLISAGEDSIFLEKEL